MHVLQMAEPARMFNSRAVIKMKDFGHSFVMRKGWVVFWETPSALRCSCAADILETGFPHF